MQEDLAGKWDTILCEWVCRWHLGRPDHLKPMSGIGQCCSDLWQSRGACARTFANQHTISIVISRGSRITTETDKLYLVRVFVTCRTYLWTAKKESFGCNLANHFQIKGFCQSTSGVLFLNQDHCKRFSTVEAFSSCFHKRPKGDAISSLVESAQWLGVVY